MQPVPTEADKAYFREYFITLDQACEDTDWSIEDVRRWMAAGELPRPSYVLDGGTEIVPPDYFDLVDEAGGIDELRGWFAEGFVGAGGAEADLADEWDGYLSGLYGVCLKRVTPSNIVRKSRLVEEIDAMLVEPRPEDPAWAEQLRVRVDALDKLEKPFAPDYDAARLGQSSRDRCITKPRRRFPELFAVSV